MTSRKKTKALYDHILRNKSLYEPGRTLTRAQFIRKVSRLFPKMRTAVPYDSRSNPYFANNLNRLNKILAYMGLKVKSSNHYHEFRIIGGDDVVKEVSRLRKCASNLATSANTLEYNYRMHGSAVRPLAAVEIERIQSHIYSRIV